MKGMQALQGSVFLLLVATQVTGHCEPGLLSSRAEMMDHPLQPQGKVFDGIRKHFLKIRLGAKPSKHEHDVILTCQSAEQPNTAPPGAEDGILSGPIPILFDLGKRAIQSFRQPTEKDVDADRSKSKEARQEKLKAENQFMLNKMLFKAAEKGYSLETERLLRNGAQVNARNGQDLDRWTALHYGAAFGKVSVCRVLLANGADPNIPDWDHWTPLHYAAYGSRAEHTAVARELLAHGADAHAANWAGKTPRVLAEEYAPPALVELLKDAEHTQRRPPPPKMKNGVRADRESFLRQLLEEYPPPQAEGPGRAVGGQQRPAAGEAQ